MAGRRRLMMVSAVAILAVIAGLGTGVQGEPIWAQITGQTHFVPSTKVCTDGDVVAGGFVFSCVLTIRIATNDGLFGGEEITATISGTGVPGAPANAQFVGVQRTSGTCPTGIPVLTSPSRFVLTVQGQPAARVCGGGAEIVITETLQVTGGGGGSLFQVIDSTFNFPPQPIPAVRSGGAPFTVPVLSSSLKVLFIDGIGSSSSCSPGGGVPDRVSWLVNSLKARVPTLGSEDFLYYTYTSGFLNLSDPFPVCPGTSLPKVPKYTNLDACYSLDDEYTSVIRFDVPGGGQASRITSYIKGYLDSNPNTNLSIVGFSQGGVLAAYVAKIGLSSQYQSRVKAVITLDSPLRGINRAGANLLRSVNRCSLAGNQYDSAFDLLPETTITKPNSISTPVPTKLYTVDGNPGAGQVTPEIDAGCRLCSTIPATRTRFALIDDYHTDASWSTAHLRVLAELHGEIWTGVFYQGLYEPGRREGTKFQANPDGSGLVPEGVRLVRFVACGIASLSQDCANFAETPEASPSGGRMGRPVPFATPTDVPPAYR